MTFELTRTFLLWCTVFDYAVLILWFVAFACGGDWLYRMHGRWFHFSREQFDAIHYAGMSVYKIGILLFNLVPLVVLTFLR